MTLLSSGYVIVMLRLCKGYGCHQVKRSLLIRKRWELAILLMQKVPYQLLSIDMLRLITKF